MRSGVIAARAAVVATLDGDGQNDPAFIPALLAALEQGAPRIGLVAGQRVGRKATGFKRLQSRIANAVRGAVLQRRHARHRLRPEGVSAAMCSWRCPISTACIASCRRWCGAKATTSAMSTWSTGRARHGMSNYGLWDRLWVGILDLAGVWWLIRRRKRVPQSDGGDPMLVDLSRAVGAYLHDVFVTRLDWWVLLGFVAQALFTVRFLVQWIASERAGHSVIPLAFWIFSIGGGLLLLVYALYRRIRCSSPARRSACSSTCATCISSCATARRRRRLRSGIATSL